MGKTYSVLGIIYCYLMKYRLSLGHFSISIQQNCFINTLKNIHPITLHGCLIVVIVMTKVAVANRDSLIPNGDESNVLDDDKNVSQTFDIPLKIKSLFQLIYCNILKGKKNTIAHNELKCNLWNMQDSRIANMLQSCKACYFQKQWYRYTITNPFFEKSVYHSCYG